MNNKDKKLIAEFERAVREHEVIGSKDPEDQVVISCNYFAAKRQLMAHIISLRAVLKYYETLIR